MTTATTRPTAKWSALLPYSLPGALIVILAVFGSLRPEFLGVSNLSRMAAQMSVLAVVAIGLTLAMAAGQFDLSIASTVTLSASLVVGLQTQQNVGPLAAIVGAVMAGAVIGAVNGLIVTKLHVHSLIATLGTASVIGGVQLWYTDTAVTGELPSLFLAIGSGQVVGIRVPILVLGICVVGAHLLLLHSILGRHLRALGASSRASLMTGLAIDRLVVVAFVGAGVGAAIAGVLLAARIGGAPRGAGDPLLLSAFAACFLGATAGARASFSVLGTLLGAAIIEVLANGFVQLRVEAWLEFMLVGAILITAVGLSSRSRRQKA